MNVLSHNPASVYEAVSIAARLWPERPFLQTLPETANVYNIAAGEISYASMLAEADRLKAQYAAAGYRALRRSFGSVRDEPRLWRPERS